LAAQRSVAVTPWNLSVTVTKSEERHRRAAHAEAGATPSATVDIVRSGTQPTTVSNVGSYSQSKGISTFVVCPTGDPRFSSQVFVKV
jgi:hypothetical protein